MVADAASAALTPRRMSAAAAVAAVNQQVNKRTPLTRPSPGASDCIYIFLADSQHSAVAVVRRSGPAPRWTRRSRFQRVFTDYKNKGWASTRRRIGQPLAMPSYA